MQKLKKPITYKNDNGAVLKEIEVIYGNSFEALESATKDATAEYTYTFKAWTEQVDTETGNVTYTATYDSVANEYKLTINKVINGVITETKEYTVAYGTAYDYSGDYGPVDGYTLVVDGNLKDTMPATDVAINVNYTINVFTITWIVDGAETKETYEYGATPSFKGETTKAADAQYTYTFTGWDKEIAEVAGDATYTATYEAKANEYKVIVNTVYVDKVDSTVDATETFTYAYDTEYSVAAPLMEGYTLTTEGVLSGKMPANDVTITLTYTANSYTVTVTYTSDDGKINETKTETLTYGENYNVATPEKTGYTADKASVTGTVTGDVNEAVKYTANKYNLTIKYQYDDGTEAAATHEETVVYGTEYSVESPAITGYSSNNPVVSGTMGADDLTITVVYSKKTYTVIWHNEDGTVLETDENVPYYTMPEYNGEIPTKAATAEWTYTFDKWEPTVSVVTGDVTYTATFTATKNKYALTINYVYENGTEAKSAHTAEVEYGATYSVDSPVIEGYTANIEVVSGTMDENGSVVTVTYKVNSYVLTINYKYADGTVAKPTYTADVNYNESYSVASPAITGYTADTAVVEGTMGTDDVTVEVTYTVNSYKLTINYVYANGTEAAESHTADVNYGTDYSVVTPEIVGYTADIKVVEGTMGTDDVTVEVTYTVNNYKLTINYVYADGTVASETFEEIYTFVDTYSVDSPVIEGYTADITIVSGDFKDAKNIEVTVTYTINVYKVIFVDFDGTQIGDIQNVNYQSAATAPTTPAREGYTFTGWDKAFNSITADTTVTAQYEINQYTITFDTVGGTAIDAVTQDYGTAVTAPAAPTKEGFTFAGWDVEVPATMPAENVTITAKWTVNQYTITFDTDGGTAIDAITQDYGTAVTAPAAPTKEGFTFAGWDVEVPGTMPAGDVTITAKWTVNQYTITFDTDGGTAIDAVTQDYGTAVTAPAAPTREGYIFAGWDVEVPATMPAENVTITAKWTVNQYTITFDTDGGTTIDAITQDYGTAVTAPAAPTKEGFTFAGWDVEVPGTMPAGDVTITAKWTVNQYTITFDTDGGTAIDAVTQDYGTAVTAPAAPTKEGFTFAGWDVEVPATMPAENVTITAKWTVNQYTITFDTDGGTTIDAITQDYGTAVTAPAAPTKEGFTFAGWDTEIPGTMPAENVIIKAQWTINIYTVTFVDNEGVKTEVEYDYGTTAEDISVPVNTANKYNAEGHFAYTWPEISDVTGDVTYKEIETKTEHDYEVVVTTPTCEAGGYTTHTCKNAECKHTYTDAETSATGHDYDKTKSEANLTRPVQNSDGTWTEGYYTYTCNNDRKHTMTETVKRADYTVFEEAEKKLKELLDTDLTDEAKAAIQEVLNEYENMADNLIETEQATLTAAADKLTEAFDDYASALKTYTVTFVVDGKTVKTETVVSGMDATAPAEPTKAADADNHYSFSGWNNVFTNITADTTVTAEFESEAHTFTHTDKDDTYHTDKCACGYETDVEHSYNGGFITTAPTCSDKGEKTFTCSLCSGTKTEVVDEAPDAHKWETVYTVDKKASCDVAGQKSYHCEYCNTINAESAVVIAQRTHNIVDTTVETEATCTDTGIMNQKCNHAGSDEYEACTYTTTRVIEKDVDNHTGTEQLVNYSEATCTENGYTGDMQWSCCKVTTKTGTVITKLGHKDEDKDHICDNGCEEYQGEHKDTDFNHACDYGCTDAIGEHKDSSEDKDHVCDYGCGVVLEECMDTDKDHACDNGCNITFGTCEDTDKDHDCDYGCDKYFGIHADSADDKDHACDYGCGAVLEECVDADKDHACDNGCNITFGTCEDTDKDHDCDYGCDKYFGIHADSAEDKDHVCDYGCGAVLEECADTDKDHDCDYGCDKYFGIHADSAEDKDHVCDYGCGAVLEECVDADKDHKCDNGCDVYHGTHEDTDFDHDCDYGCKETIGDCEDKDLDHDCDYGCDKVYGDHADKNKDHACDYGCKETIGTCEDTDFDHACDYGCSKVYGEHKDSATDKDHVCDYGCGETIEECVDGEDNNHNCDICDKEDVSEHVWEDVTCTSPSTCSVCGAVSGEALGHKDENKDHICENGCGMYQGIHDDTNKDHVCDYGCSEAIGTCEDADNDHDCDYGCDKVYGEHLDGNKDHICDYGCKETIGECTDSAEDKDHVCDYGCGAVLEECVDADKDHKCDNGCDVYHGTHEDTDFDHDCDYGCKETIGDCEDKDLDHDCDYGCDKVYGDHADGDKDHACDYGCKETIGDCEDKDLDHDCDYGCDKVYGDHLDGNKDHVCDYGCKESIGECTDSAEDKDHVCDYGCGAVLEECVDADKDHKCDNGCDVYHGTHEDTDFDHDCDYGCKETIGDCEDKDLDHDCDYGCDKVYGDHADGDKDHACDYGCKETIGDCEDKDLDHDCDYGCDKVYGDHLDGNKDHVCDYGCKESIGECTDSAEDKDHVCDYGCGAVLEECVDADKDHKCDNGCDVYHGTHEDTDFDHDCDYGCKETIGDCEDKDLDHDCDYGCDKVYGDHADGDKDHACDYGCKETIGTCEDTDFDHACDYGCDKVYGEHKDSATDNDHVCDYGCGVTLEECADGDDNNHNCDICNKEDVSEHVWVAATCTTPRTCSVCGETDGTELGHEYEGIVTTEPGCLTEGEKTFTCKNDANHTYTESIDALGHDYQYTKTVAHTCDTDGYDLYDCSRCDAYEHRNVVPAEHTNVVTDKATEPTCEETGLTEGSHCEACDTVIVAQTEVPATGHDYKGTVTKAAECDVDGIMTYTCANDSTHTYEEAIPKTGHTEEVLPAVDATCTATGLTAGKKCSVCGDILVAQTVTGAHGHKYVGEVTKEATCTEKGVMTYTCTHDESHTYEEEIALKAHTIVKVDYKAPKCEATGWEAYEYCSVCDTYNTYVEIPATGHNYDSGVITTEPTCEGKGVKTFTCKNDNSHTYTEEVAATGHSFDMTSGVLTRPAKVGGVWADGYYTYTCTNDSAHTKTEAVKRADYSEYDKLIENADKILGLDIPEEDREKLEEVLANNDIPENLIASEQDMVDAVLDDIRNVISEVYPDSGLTLEIRGASTFYVGTVLDLKAFKVNEFVDMEASDVTWVSSDDDIVFFSNGRLFAIGTGTVTLTAISGLLTATKTVTIVEGGNARAVKFTAIDNMHFIVEDYFAIFNGATLRWSDDYTIRFRVHTYQSFPFETYIVYVNGQVVEPDEDGYYTVPANEGNIMVTIAGAVYDDDGTGSASKFNFWEWLLALLRKIVNFFKNLFGIA